MVSEGLLYRKHGHGTFVAGPKLVQSDAVVSFSHDMRSRGMKPGGRVLVQTVQPASDHIAARLEIRATAPVLHLVRVRTADGVPMAIERAYIPAERFPELDKADLHDASLWYEIERRWVVRVGSAEQRVSAVLPSREDVAALEVAKNQPCLAIEGVSRDTSGVVIEYGRSLYRGDRYDVLRLARLTEQIGNGTEIGPTSCAPTPGHL